jgi:hypothetical protein
MTSAILRLGLLPVALRKEAAANKPDPDISCSYDVHTSSGHSHYASRAMTYDPDGNPQYYFSEGFVADAYSVDFPFHHPDSANRASDYETGARC